jgi:hypothetical protein
MKLHQDWIIWHSRCTPPFNPGPGEWWIDYEPSGENGATFSLVWPQRETPSRTQIAIALRELRHMARD